jgi:hypothetical protein
MFNGGGVSGAPLAEGLEDTASCRVAFRSSGIIVLFAKRSRASCLNQTPFLLITTRLISPSPAGVYPLWMVSIRDMLPKSFLRILKSEPLRLLREEKLLF